MVEPSRAVSGASELRATLARLQEAGEALRARPLARRLDPLGELLDRLAAPASKSRDGLAQRLPAATGLHPATVAAGLERALGAWSARALRELVAAELHPSRQAPAAGAGDPGPSRLAQGFPATALLLGGSLPMPGLLSMLLPLAIGSPVLARPGRHDPVTAPFVAAELRALDPELGACVECVDFDHDDHEALAAFLAAPCVVATGSDETMQRIAQRTPASTRLVRYGHRLSVAVWTLAPGANETRVAAHALAEDVSLWDQLGCLSPLAVYVASPDGRVAPEVEDAISAALEEVAVRWPRGALDPTSRAALAHEADTVELRAGAEQGVHLRRGRDWTLVSEADARMRAAPLHRFVRLHPVRDPASLGAALAPLARQLAAVGVTPGTEPAWLHAIAAAGPSRVCGLGRMQAPPIGWSHDGQGPLRPLVRLTDVEGPFALPVDGAAGQAAKGREAFES